jgi:hypothetical protein
MYTIPQNPFFSKFTAHTRRLHEAFLDRQLVLLLFPYLHFISNFCTMIWIFFLQLFRNTGVALLIRRSVGWHMIWRAYSKLGYHSGNSYRP